MPESGVIGELEGTRGVSLYCAIWNGDIPIQTNWFLQTLEDRGIGRLISTNDDNFILSGEAINLTSGISVPSNTNLTIVSLTGDLQHAIIRCISGQGTKLANFTLEVYGKDMNKIIRGMWPCPWYTTTTIVSNTWGL